MQAAAFRHHMIDGQLEPNRVLSSSICAAMGIVSREWFVPKALENCAYADDAVPLGDDRYLVSPLLLGQLLQALDVRAGQKILVMGGGTGYSAAVLHHLGCKVYMLEESQDLANQARQILTKNGMGEIEVHAGSFHMGCESMAPFDRILVEGGVQKRPEIWEKQLSQEGGLLAYVQVESVLPLANSGRGFIRTIKRDATQWLDATLEGVATPILPGTEIKKGFDFA